MGKRYLNWLSGRFEWRDEDRLVIPAQRVNEVWLQDRASAGDLTFCLRKSIWRWIRGQGPLQDLLCQRQDGEAQLDLEG